MPVTEIHILNLHHNKQKGTKTAYHAHTSTLRLDN